VRGEEAPVDSRFGSIAGCIEEGRPVVQPGKSQEEYREADSSTQDPCAPCAYKATKTRPADQGGAIEPKRDRQ